MKYSFHQSAPHIGSPSGRSVSKGHMGCGAPSALVKCSPYIPPGRNGHGRRNGRQNIISTYTRRCRGEFLHHCLARSCLQGLLGNSCKLLTAHECSIIQINEFITVTWLLLHSNQRYNYSCMTWISEVVNFSVLINILNTYNINTYFCNFTYTLKCGRF